MQGCYELDFVCHFQMHGHFFLNQIIFFITISFPSKIHSYRDERQVNTTWSIPVIIKLQQIQQPNIVHAFYLSCLLFYCLNFTSKYSSTHKQIFINLPICISMSHCRILAAELWHQDKNNVAKELGQLRKLKMQQVLKEMEEQDEFKAAQEYYGEKAYQEWIQVIIQSTCHR